MAKKVTKQRKPKVKMSEHQKVEQALLQDLADQRETYEDALRIVQTENGRLQNEIILLQNAKAFTESRIIGEGNMADAYRRQVALLKGIILEAMGSNSY